MIETAKIMVYCQSKLQVQSASKMHPLEIKIEPNRRDSGHFLNDANVQDDYHRYVILDLK